jgi:hypothetical protein
LRLLDACALRLLDACALLGSGSTRECVFAVLRGVEPFAFVARFNTQPDRFVSFDFVYRRATP